MIRKTMLKVLTPALALGLLAVAGCDLAGQPAPTATASATGAPTATVPPSTATRAPMTDTPPPHFDPRSHGNRDT